MTRLKIFDIRKWIDAFLRDAKVRELSAFTIEYYRAQLAIFEPFAKSNDECGRMEQPGNVQRNRACKSNN